MSLRFGLVSERVEYVVVILLIVTTLDSAEDGQNGGISIAYPCLFLGLQSWLLEHVNGGRSEAISKIENTFPTDTGTLLHRESDVESMGFELEVEYGEGNINPRSLSIWQLDSSMSSCIGFGEPHLAKWAAGNQSSIFQGIVR